MKKFLVFLCAVMLVFGVVGSGSATVLDFENHYVYSPPYYQPIPNGYGGFNWNSDNPIYVINGPWSSPNSGFDIGSVSGDMVAFNSAGLSPSRIELAGPGTFTFNGAWFTSVWNDLTVQFEGYNDGSLIFTSSVYNINTTNPLWIQLDWSGIDSLKIINTYGYPWAMDDFTYNESPVPISSTVLLLGSGLLGLAGYGRKRFTKKG